MYRTEIESLIRWKNSKTRKPLIIRGARQVGKTWLMKEFGKEEYNRTIYINFESSSHLINIFNTDFDIQRILTALQIETGIIANKHDTLIIFAEFKGAVTEQFVLQQLICDKKFDIYYWSAERSTAELDFLIQNNDKIVPIEVKAEENLQAKSLKVFCQKFNQPTAIRTSMSDYRKESWLTNIPLYSINFLTNEIK